MQNTATTPRKHLFPFKNWRHTELKQTIGCRVIFSFKALNRFIALEEYVNKSQTYFRLGYSFHCRLSKADKT